MPDVIHDVAIVGGGIVGLAVAHALVNRAPGLRIVLLEKEDSVGRHQTSHNSGVIHSGLYYRPGSSKARTSIRGARLLQTFCSENAIPFSLCGKLVVATRSDELPRLEELYRRGTENGVAGLKLIGPTEISGIEPHVRGLRALHVPGAGIVEFKRVADTLALLVVQRGGEVQTGAEVRAIDERETGIVIHTTRGSLEARYLVSCAGLYSDRVARSAGAHPASRIVPFRGEYYELIESRRHLIRALVYPVPDPGFPFLGVHFTRMIDGRVEAGPNAVLALAREGYRKRDVSLYDFAATVTYPGFWRLASRHWRMGLEEIHRSFSKTAFVRALQRLVPDLSERDVVPGGSGVRAQALAPDGQLIDDFLVVETRRGLHVCNAPSPAATASLAIGEEIAMRVTEKMGKPADLPDS